MAKLTNAPTVVCEGPVQVYCPQSQVFVSRQPRPEPLDTDAANLRNFGNYGFEAYASVVQQRVVEAPIDDDPLSRRPPRTQDVKALDPRKVG